jgi:hypothetical protein
MSALEIYHSLRTVYLRTTFVGGALSSLPKLASLLERWTLEPMGNQTYLIYASLVPGMLHFFTFCSQ